MNNRTIELLEFPEIIDRLAALTTSQLGKKLVRQLTPSNHPVGVAEKLRETTEARNILESSGSPPLYGLADLTEELQKVQKGAVLDPLALQRIADFLRGCRKTKEYMERRIEMAPVIARYAMGLSCFPDLEDEILRCIVDGVVGNDASSKLRKIRNEINHTREKIKAKLQQIVSSSEMRAILQETVVSVKDSRQVLLVKASHKNLLPGIVMGSSGSGSTLYVEPMAVHHLSNELRSLEAAEQEEVYQILAGLSGEVSEYAEKIEANLEIMAQYDFAFAKARLSRDMKAVEPSLNEAGSIQLIGARHPLLTNEPVPLDFHIGPGSPGGEYRSLVITGPNTGGKTVTIKTIGLLTIMAQSGLHIPAGSGSKICVFENVLADIGDGQNIAQSLSTFSAHISNIIRIIQESRNRALVLLDEVGTGTDPSEGSALAVAILEHFYRQGVTTLASTHYPEIKEYALKHEGFRNGCMGFDKDNLQPLYRLIIGRPGESNALWIARKLGMPQSILDRAARELPEKQVSTSAAMTPASLPVIHTYQEPVKPLKPNEEKCVAKTPVTSTVKTGDLVSVSYLGEKGVVCSGPDPKGRIRVLIQDKKMELPVKRVKLMIPAEELYPEDYDLNIVLLTKEERKMKHQMGRKIIPGAERVISPDEV